MLKIIYFSKEVLGTLKCYIPIVPNTCRKDQVRSFLTSYEINQDHSHSKESEHYWNKSQIWLADNFRTLFIKKGILVISKNLKIEFVFFSQTGVVNHNFRTLTIKKSILIISRYLKTKFKHFSYRQVL